MITTQPPQMPTPPWSASPPLPPIARNGFGITALALALTGVVFGLVPFTGFLALILGALAVLFGLLGGARVRRGEATNRRMTFTGTMLGVLVAALGIWGISITFNAMNKLGTDLQGIGQQSSSAVATEAPSTYSDAPVPQPTDFAISVKVLSKACFGSAGCSVTYQIDPHYWHGSTAPLSGRAFTVIYEVSGGKGGPQINNFTINSNGTAHYQRQEFVSTSSSGTTLTARATNVSTN